MRYFDQYLIIRRKKRQKKSKLKIKKKKKFNKKNLY